MSSEPGRSAWLIEDRFSVRSQLRNEGAARGIGAEQLVFGAGVPYAEHIERMRHANLALDTFPYQDDVAVHDALSVGIPVLTQAGNSFSSRVGSCLVSGAGLPEMVVGDALTFTQAAVRFATDAKELAALTARLRKNMSEAPVFDAKRLQTHLEKAFVTMIERHRQGLAAESFSVPRHSH